MNQFYVVYGEEEYLIERQIQKIFAFYNKKAQTNINISELNSDSSFSDFLFYVENEPMFDDYGLILCDNVDILLNKSLSHKDAQYAIKNLQINQKNIFIFKFNTNKIESDNQLMSFILENAKNYVYKKLSEHELISWIKQYVSDRGSSIDSTAITKIVLNVPNELLVISKEIDKLIARNNIIKIDDEMDFKQYQSNDPFIVQNCLEQKNFSALYVECEKNMLIPEEANKLLYTFANFFSLPSQYFCYRKAGYSEREIQEIVKIHPFRLKKAANIISLYGMEQINNILLELAKIDIARKKYPITDERWLSMFIIKLIDIAK